MSTYSGTRRPIIFWLAKLVTRIIFGLSFDIKVFGLENLPPNGSFILLPKHQRWEDIPILGLVIQRPLYYIAKYELFINPVSSFLISSMGGVPLNRNRPRESLNGIIKMFDTLMDGEGVVIFPEGTYFEGRMGQGKTGLLRMIQSHLTLPYIPVGINYEGKRRRTPVIVRLGTPVIKNSKEVIENFSSLIMKEIADLSGLEEYCESVLNE